MYGATLEGWPGKKRSGLVKGQNELTQEDGTSTGMENSEPWRLLTSGSCSFREWNGPDGVSMSCKEVCHFSDRVFQVSKFIETKEAKESHD